MFLRGPRCVLLVDAADSSGWILSLANSYPWCHDTDMLSAHWTVLLYRTCQYTTTFCPPVIATQTARGVKVKEDDYTSHRHPQGNLMPVFHQCDLKELFTESERTLTYSSRCLASSSAGPWRRSVWLLLSGRGDTLVPFWKSRGGDFRSKK